jgi:diguanylate cyclase (GGDEF)-like protein
MQSSVLSGGGEFVDSARESEYRAAHLMEFVRQVRLCFCYAVLLNVLFLLVDWRFHGHPRFYWAISARAVLVSVSVAGLWAIAKIRSFRELQLIYAIWTCFVLIAGAVLVSSQSGIALLVTFIMPAIFYLVVPASFRLTLACGFGCSAVLLAAYILPAPAAKNSLGLILGMLFSNVILVLVLLQSNRLRRLEWAAVLAQRAANEELSESRDNLQRIVKAIPTPLVITARDTGDLIHANDAACEYFGPGLLMGSLRIADHLAHLARDKSPRNVEPQDHAAASETRLHLPDGSVRDVLLQFTTMAVAGYEAILTVFVDITHRKEVEAIMERMANTDPLTGLPNRTRFFHVAAEEISRAERYKNRLAVFMVDIDYFKRINDTHGHKAGDLALKAFAELCRKWIRRQDLVARLGGEEFGFLLPETDAASSMALAERLRTEVEGLRVEKVQTSMTISIGVSEILPGESTVDAALSRADQALYAAKRAGRNRVVLYNRAKHAPGSHSLSAEERRQAPPASVSVEKRTSC